MLNSKDGSVVKETLSLKLQIQFKWWKEYFKKPNSFFLILNVFWNWSFVIPRYNRNIPQPELWLLQWDSGQITDTEIFTLLKVKAKFKIKRWKNENIRALILLVNVCILVMGYCQGVISHPDIVIFYRTASTTGTVFLFTVFDFSFFINFRGALILCEMKFRNNFPCFYVLPWH